MLAQISSDISLHTVTGLEYPVVHLAEDISPCEELFQSKV
jgi:hypothetical protein